MPNVLKILRSIVAGVRPTGKSYGEPYVNFADNQFGVVDSSNAARDLLGVPIFSASRSYASGLAVSYQGVVYVSQVAVSPGTFNPAQWSPVATIATVQSTPAFTTGDVKLTLKTASDPGWIFMNDGSIGDASSSATFADPTAQALFLLLWTNVADANAPVSGGRGASAAADWAAHKRITLTKVLGRALSVAGAGAGLTNRPLGSIAGAELHGWVGAELIQHNHSPVLTTPTHRHVYPTSYAINIQAGYVSIEGGATYNVALWGGFLGASNDTTSYSGTGESVSENTLGSSQAINIVGPMSFLNVMIKL